jgi:hypothetical protein
VNETSAKVVSVYPNSRKPERGYVRHHAASFRFELQADEWFVVVDPTFHFTRDGFQAHRFPGALLAGKKRLERNAAVRGQVVMWQHLLIESGKADAGLLFDTGDPEPILAFEALPLAVLGLDWWATTDDDELCVYAIEPSAGACSRGTRTTSHPNRLVLGARV